MLLIGSLKITLQTFNLVIEFLVLLSQIFVFLAQFVRHSLLLVLHFLEALEFLLVFIVFLPLHLVELTYLSLFLVDYLAQVSDLVFVGVTTKLKLSRIVAEHGGFRDWSGTHHR